MNMKSTFNSFYPVDGVAHRLQPIVDTKFDGNPK